MAKEVKMPSHDVEWISGPQVCLILDINKDTLNSKVRVDPNFVKMGAEIDLVQGKFSQYLVRKYARREYK